jgi:hypothetical protein
MDHARSNSRVELLQTTFNDVVGPELDHALGHNQYRVTYEPAAYSDGKIRLVLKVANHRDSFDANIESTPDAFIIRSGNSTAHVRDDLLTQGMAFIKHGIIALRPTA